MQEKYFLRIIVRAILRLIFRLEVNGQENIEAAGDRVIIVVNHLSFLEPLLIGAFLPATPSYAINIYQANKFTWLEKIFHLYRLDPSKPLSMKRLIQNLRNSKVQGVRRVVIFPEGRISTSGGIMKIYDGTGMLIEKTGATVLPVRIDGTQYSKLSQLRTRVHSRWFPKVTLTFLPPIRFESGQKISSTRIYDIMTNAAFKAAPTRLSLLEGILNAYDLHGGNHLVACDTGRIYINYRQLFTRSFILSEKLCISLKDQNYIGVLMPNSLGVMVTFISLHILGKVPCMLNFSAGKASILHACNIANLRTILTSRQFVEKGKLEPVIEALKEQYDILYLEDIRPSVKISDKLLGLYRAFFVRTTLRPILQSIKPDDIAVVLYTSGSEGAPKGVALSHANILSNIHQFCSRVDLTTSDIIFNALPVFHSFGMTVGLLTPMIAGIRVFLYPTPLHYRIIPDLMYDCDATIMLGTDTFYNGYARYAHLYDFWNIRLCVAGAEKLRETTYRLYADRFRVHILEGYGVTETSPVISVNTPMEHKLSSVGRPLPDIKCRIQPVDGLERGGRLQIKGPNVMVGYIKEDQPGVVRTSADWYDTGDIVEIDEEGFIHILGRAKRFAKIGGEMVSLSIAEELAHTLFPENAHAIIAAPDERKGEQIVLFTESDQLTRAHIIELAKENGVAEISLPKQIIFLESLPRLGNGKIDYVSLSKLWDR